MPAKEISKEMEPRQSRGARYLWAALLARIYEVMPLADTVEHISNYEFDQRISW